MKRIFAVVLLTFTCACTPHPDPTVTPPPPGVVAAMHADDAIKALGTAAKGIEQAADQNNIPQALANQLLDVIKGAVLTISQVPSGWTDVATQALDQIQSLTPASAQPVILPIVTTARIALGVTGS